MKSKIFLLSMLMHTGALLAQAPKNVIMYIGDGYGFAAKTATRMALGQGKPGKQYTADKDFRVLAADKLRYTATVTTHSQNSWITDSAPGATVYASGVKGKVDNEAIAFDLATGTEIETILENAKKQGYAVGIVTTTRVTHATPAAFTSHIWNRDLEDYIAAQYLSKTEEEYEAVFNASPLPAYKYNVTRDWKLPAPKQNVELDVILGGGARHFLPKGILSANGIVRDAHDSVIYKTSAAAHDTVKLSSSGKGSRNDNVDLIDIAKTRGYKYVNSRDALINIDLNQFTPASNAKLIGLFRDSHCSYEQDRQLTFPWEPSLYEMTKIAIEVLQRKGGTKGFFLLVEGGRIDHLEHANCGGITIDAGNTKYEVEADKEAYPDDLVYNASNTLPRVKGIYGSDYLVKEVLAFDYAIEEGRKVLLNKPNNSSTLIFSSSDHECGGLAIVGLHDEADAQTNGTKIRTYAKQPSKATFDANPTGITRGDNTIGGWFPEYKMYDFQGKPWPMPVSETARRIVVAYGSNPLTNGNSTAKTGSPGNHTPQDVWVGADDNTGGTYASQITGQGLLDNTYLTHIMADFLGLKDFLSVAKPVNNDNSSNIYPNPFNDKTTIEFNLPSKSITQINVYNSIGQLVTTLNQGSLDEGAHSFIWNGKNARGETLSTGNYFVVIKSDDVAISKQVIYLK